MSIDLTSLIIKVDSSQIKSGDTALQKLINTSTGVDSAIRRMEGELKRASEAADVFASAFREGEAVTRAMMTPTEQYEEKIQNLNNLLGISAVSQETYNRALESAEAELNRLSGATDAAQQAQNEINQKMEAGRQLTESLRTPAEAYKDRLAEIKDLLQSGAINQETYNRALSQADTDLQNAGKSSDLLTSALKRLTVAAAAYKALQFGKQAAELYQAQAIAEAKLEPMIRATGMAAGFTTSQLKDMAASLQDATGYATADISNMHAVLLGFRDISGDLFERTTKAVLDMTSVMGGDLVSNVNILGKAIDSPVQGMASLGRAGFVWTKQQREMVAEMEASGDLLGAQTVILEEVEKAFSGVSEAIRNTPTGELKALKLEYKDIQTALGEDLIPTLVELQKIVNSSVKFLVENKEILAYTAMTLGIAKLTPAVIALTTKIKALNLAMLANPLVAVAAGIAMATIAVYKHIQSIEEQTKALNAETDEITKNNEGMSRLIPRLNELRTAREQLATAGIEGMDEKYRLIVKELGGQEALTLEIKRQEIATMNLRAESLKLETSLDAQYQLLMLKERISKKTLELNREESELIKRTAEIERQRVKAAEEYKRLQDESKRILDDLTGGYFTLESAVNDVNKMVSMGLVNGNVAVKQQEKLLDTYMAGVFERNQELTTAEQINELYKTAGILEEQRLGTAEQLYDIANKYANQIVDQTTKQLDSIYSLRKEFENIGKVQSDLARQHESDIKELETAYRDYIDAVKEYQLSTGEDMADAELEALKTLNDKKRALNEEYRRAEDADKAQKREDLFDGLLTELEIIQKAYEDRKKAIVASVALTEKEKTELLLRNEHIRDAAILGYHAKQIGYYADAGDAILDILKSTAGEQSKIYKSMFLVSKGFALAEAIVKMQQAIALANASAPYPYNIPAIAQAAAIGVSTIAGIGSAVFTAFAGEFANGGKIPAGQWGIVGETGRPEIVSGPATVVGVDETENLLKSSGKSEYHTHFHIGTLIADERGIKELERRQAKYRVSENQRIGVL